MKFQIPILVSQTPGAEPIYEARPLFHKGPGVRGPLLERVLPKLAAYLRKQFSEMATANRLEALASYAYYPNLYDKTFTLELPQKKRTIKGRFLVVVLPETEPRLAFIPDLPGLWFQVDRGEDLRHRTIEVLDNYYSRGAGRGLSAEFNEHRWVTDLELNFRVPEKPPVSRHASDRMLLGGPPVKPGWAELEKVGRSLDDLHPHDLASCLCRDAEASRLYRALSGSKRSPQIVVGPRKVGKTSLSHEMVRRYRLGKGPHERRFWLLSPQRLISGMSFVGQWESRLLAILKHAKEKDLILVFDDLLGLFSAGMSRDSNLSVANVLQPYIQRGEVRVLAEATEDGLAILRERSRGFADLFTITRLNETSERETLEIALEEIREAERFHACSFHIEALRTAIDLQRRYVRDASFPGKSAAFLRKVAARKRSEEVGRQDVLDYFHRTSGMSMELLDDRKKLMRGEVHKAMAQRVMGQPQAVEVATEAVMMAKARLCDPSRPVASLLFVGPTGVGKTECAKALASYLFGSDERLMRFDMNEYVSPGSATRLVGTFHQPDGLLTSLVRRRPFCVILLDEIEKAHHEVFNLLLQVLGDGRLTDARGRTVDFTQAIIILTSNLGVREASKPIGFRSKAGEEDLTYRRAVEQFFPPEFFNRLDRVVPFSRLSREDTALLAKRLIYKVLGREGLVRRQCILNVYEDAMERIVDMGFHPQLGARALKRSIEQAVSAPVSARLTEMKPHAPTVISIQSIHDRLDVSVRELRASARRVEVPWQTIGPFLSGVEQQLETREAALETPDGLVGEGLSEEQLAFYATQDRIRRANAICRKLRAYQSSKEPARKPESRHELLYTPSSDGLLTSPNLSQAMKGLRESLPSKTEERRFQSKFVELLAELSLLEEGPAGSEMELELRFNQASRESALRLAKLYKELLEDLELEASVQSLDSLVRVSVKGPQAHQILSSELGVHLFTTGDGLVMVEVREAHHTDSSATIAPVQRVYDFDYGSVDLRSGWMSPGLPTVEEMKLLVLSAGFHSWEVVSK